MHRSEGDPGFSDEEQTLLQDVAERASLFIGTAKLHGQVDVHRRELEHLSRQLVAVQEAERRALAREMHDEIGGALTGLSLLLPCRDAVDDPDVADALDETRKHLREVLERVRGLALNLRPSMLDELGLIPALTWHLDRFGKQSGIQVDFTHEGLPARCSPDVETAAFRIVQEALTNVSRHAAASQVSVSLRALDGVLFVSIADDGKGFQTPTGGASRPSTGLTSMRERALALGGRFQVESAHEAGTTVTAELPLGALVPIPELAGAF